MLLDTQITMPSQDPMAEREFPLGSRDIRKWIKALPYIDQNLAAQKFYDGLRRSNRQAHPTKQRLTAIEIMRPVARDFLKEQRKYLATQTFPLSNNSNKVLKLQQNILSELAVAYKIILQEAANRDIQLNPKKLITCIHHAMHYMLEQYVTLAQVYSEPPQGYWQDYCQLYKMAEHIELSHFSVKNETHFKTAKSSVNCLFKQACVLSLANLHTYGHGETEKISAYLESVSHLTTLSDKKTLQDNNGVYVINLATNKPPRLIAANDIPISSENRFLDPAALVNELRKTESNKSDEPSEVILSNSTLNKSLAKRLLNKLSSKPKRAAKRAISSKEKLNVVLGLRDVISTLLQNDADANEKQILAKTNLDLLPIEQHHVTSSHNIHTTFNQETRVDYSSNAWECVGRGNIVSKSHQSTSTSTAEYKDDIVKIKPIAQSWEISNASNGGYCLKSNNNSDYQSQVGDLVLLRREDHQNEKWRLGIVRWMQTLSDRGIKIGIETLNGDVLPVAVIDINQTLNKFKGLEHVLQFTEKTLNSKIITLIAPPNSINTGESIDIQLDGKKQTVAFQHSIERTMSFVRFSFSIQQSSSSKSTRISSSKDQ